MGDDGLVLEFGFGSAVHGVRDTKPFREQVAAGHIAHGPADEAGAVIASRGTSRLAGTGSTSPNV